ncbi:uncharacterized protein K452DRAFT_236552 [Aplosporella prunicola CBS 121167]|uniref:Thioredoxin domain-containing protein n=1 Tax=Aplosporella prunicola CBS 121167 TaxID=1176127 RepID=A0A6A6AYM3_9PEZI|nr:uncharacterized protein K452DRAFT_236552 [Aplosporella prunicola CBS 121167]KAF2137032.1 hypothetical protein K452DRAFT_236552 [Aplosporella prunicola CBS 121167]
MSLAQEFSSWRTPEAKPMDPVPEIGSTAPSTDKLGIPGADGRSTVVTFLRHCGCPFAEKTFLSMRATAASHPSIRFVAVSHSDAAATDKWLGALGGPGTGDAAVTVLSDPDRTLFARWGLGVSSFWHVLSPWALWAVYRLGADEGIWNRPTESGNRWQTAGSFAVDARGKVVWGRPAASASEVVEFGDAVAALERVGSGEEGGRIRANL